MRRRLGILACVLVLFAAPGVAGASNSDTSEGARALPSWHHVART